MKKVLLATTMLVAGASIAAAEVTLSGDARMGILNDFAAPGAFDPTTFTSRARVTFTMSGESDSGLSFGASFRADNATGAASGTAGSVFISGAFGKLSMGDVDGAANAAVGHIDGVGLTGLKDLNESLFVANGGIGFADVLALGGINAPIVIPGNAKVDPLTNDPTALYEYSAGNFAVYASVTLPGYRGKVVDAAGTTLLTWDSDAYAVGVAYTLDNYKFSLGYEDLSASIVGTTDTLDVQHVVAGADATFGAFTAKVRYGQADIEDTGVQVDLEQFALSGAYKVDAVSLTGFYSTVFTETPAGANISWREAIGLGASYDLGGGATVKGGVVQRETQLGAAAKQKDTSFDLGVAFTF